MKETMTVEQAFEGLPSFARLLTDPFNREVLENIRITLASHIQAQAEEVERLKRESEGRRVALLEKAEEANREWHRAEQVEAELARVRVLANAWRNRSIRQSVERLRDAGDTYEWATAKAEASAIEFEDEFTRAPTMSRSGKTKD